MCGWQVICLVTFFLVLQQYMVISANFDGNVGDPCSTKTNVPGTCVFISSCAAAIAEIRKGKFPEDICGFVGTKSLVCCKGFNVPKVTTDKKPIGSTMKPTTTKSTGSTTKVTGASPTPGSRTREMCKKYGKYAYETKESPTLSIIPSITTTLECAFEKEKLIVGGRAASRKEFPHMAQIGYFVDGETSYQCGGSLISESFVLTAAHCLTDVSVGVAKVVRVGITNLTDVFYAQTRNVTEVIAHPSYKNKYHDIGLLRVESAFEMNPFVRPACLYTQKQFPVENCLASGWGRIQFAGDGSDTLLKVTLEFFPVASCNKTYRRDIIQPDSALKNGIRDDIMICAGSSKDLKDTCQGDSGGPLQIYHDDRELKCMYDIVGVTAFGKACGLALNVPGAYTRVSAYIQWIESIVWA